MHFETNAPATALANRVLNLAKLLLLAGLATCAVVAPAQAAAPMLSIADARVLEGDSGSRLLGFNVSLSTQANGAVTFSVATSNGSGIAPADYAALNVSNVTIPAGQTSTVVTVSVYGDATAEANETVFVGVNNIVGATAADSQAVGQILNDDGTVLISVPLDPTDQNGTDAPSRDSSVSSDGRYVAFVSAASDLAPQTPGQFADTFVRDVQNGITTLVSVAVNGGRGDSESSNPSISGDGRYVAFQSSSTNLIAADANFKQDIFLRDLTTGTTTLVTVPISGTSGANEHSYNPVISADGRYVAFESIASNLVANDPNGGVSDVFVRDMQTAVTRLVTIAADGVSGANLGGSDAAISADGRYVAFTSKSSNLVGGGSNGFYGVFRRDMQSGINFRVSVAPDGGSPNNGDSFTPSMSSDGRYVAFISSADNLIVPHNASGSFDVYVRDMQAETTALASVATDGVSAGDDGAWSPSISADGRYVAFESRSKDLVANDPQDLTEIFVRDLQAGTTERVSAALGGLGTQHGSFHPSISADGQHVTFESVSKNIVVGDDINTINDVFRANSDGSSTPSPLTLTLQATDQYLWMVPPAANTQRQGFVRVMNRENRSGLVSVWGLDAAGQRSAGTVSLTLAPNESRQFNSSDLEFGSPSKGLSGSIGQGSGDWTVVVRSELDLEALAYIRTPDGFLTAMHDRVVGDGVDWFVPMFNPASNFDQVSHLRVINTNLTQVSLIILGVDDSGVSGAHELTITLPALGSVDLTAEDLEDGSGGKGLFGRLGNGTGKWHLSLSATGRITVQSLLSDPLGKLTNLSTLPDLSEPAPGEKVLWLVPPASNTQQQGFVRLINRENRSSTVALWGIDDAGQRSPGTITLSLAPRESRQLNSQDLEWGNAAKGLSGNLGDGIGNWRLHVLTDLDLLPMALIRTPDGFLTTIHDTAAAEGLTARVPIFNPADNPNQVSVLRLVNPNTVAASVTIRGVDDLGAAGPSGMVTLSLAAGSAIELSATDLESGNVGKGLTGGLGNGSGKWMLMVAATGSVKVLSLLRDPMGYLTDLSTGARGSSGKLDP